MCRKTKLYGQNFQVDFSETANATVEGLKP